MKTFLYSWGANSHGQLGVGYKSEMCDTPQLLQNLPFPLYNIKSITGGGGHVLILLNDSKIYACGWNNCGQLGINNRYDTDNTNFSYIDYFNCNSTYDVSYNVQEIYCGWDSSAALTKAGILYVWGSNLYEQLGYQKNDNHYILSPTIFNLVDYSIEQIKKMSFGLRFSLILTTKNTLYLLGSIRKFIEINKFKLHWTKIFRNNIYIWQMQSTIKNIKNIQCGQKHLIILYEDNVIDAFGDNKYYQSNGLKLDFDVTSIESGWSFNGLLNNTNGQLLLWGRNTYGQIGQESSKYVNAIKKIHCTEKIEEFHLGSEHGHFITESRALYSWGWNEHGNCGNGFTENLYHAEKMLLPGKCMLCGVGAGFAYALFLNV